jgi:hypothetical protein
MMRRRDFITLLGGAVVAARGQRAAGDAGGDFSTAPCSTSGRDRRKIREWIT